MYPFATAVGPRRSGALLFAPTSCRSWRVGQTYQRPLKSPAAEGSTSMCINNTAALLFAITLGFWRRFRPRCCPCQTTDHRWQTDRSSKANRADGLQARGNGQGHQALGR
jgi:hypothetical protein